MLEDRTFIKVGDTKTTTTLDVRNIAAANRNLQDEILRGQFREDLFYRLAAFNIELPSLNERGEVIPLLAAYYMDPIALSWISHSPEQIGNS